MPFITLDTMVFIRLQGVHNYTLKCIMSNSDVIAVTKKILNEYRGRAKPSILILQSFLKRLQQKGKIRIFKRSFIQSRIKRHRTRVNYPSDHRDRKWINVIIAVRGTHIITTDDHLLRLAPNRCGGHTINIVEPDQYTRIRCPNMPLMII